LAPSTALLKSELLREHPAFRALRVRPAPAWAKGSAEVTEERVISGSCALDLRKFAATSSRAVQRAALDTEEERVPTNDEGGTSRRERRACGSASMSLRIALVPLALLDRRVHCLPI
jgi:hypothetical protein